MEQEKKAQKQMQEEYNFKTDPFRVRSGREEPTKNIMGNPTIISYRKNKERF